MLIDIFIFLIDAIIVFLLVVPLCGWISYLAIFIYTFISCKFKSLTYWRNIFQFLLQLLFMVMIAVLNNYREICIAVVIYWMNAKQ